ncbi:MAG: AMP-binding protein [Gemmataceae bacterium]
MPARHLGAVLRRQAQRLGPRPALRWKRHGLFHDLSWADYGHQATCCAAALAEAGLRPGDRVGLLAANRLEWLIADMGILTAGAVNVPPHAPLTAAQVAYQLADAEVRLAFVSNLEQLTKIIEKTSELPLLETVVLFEGDALARVSNAGVRLRSWGEFLLTGQRALASVQGDLERRHDDLTLNDLATIMYTSGTTGVPKGVMLTHGNLLSNAEAMHELQPLGPEDLLLSWLPYSHIYGRTVDHYRSLVEGATIALGESAETVVQNLKDVQPTHMSAVPRFYEKVLTAVHCDDAGVLGKRLREVFGPRI